MKKKICFLAYLLVCCLLYGCQTKASLSIISDGEESANVSNDCALCDSQVRCYDEDSGKEIFEQSGNSTIFTSYGEGECTFIIRGMHERGIAEIDVNYGEKSVIDWERLSERLCSECLEKFENMTGKEADLADGQFKDVCLVDFKTGEVYSLEDWHTWYMIRDYYVMIDYGDDNAHITIFYAPVRKE